MLNFVLENTNTTGSGATLTLTGAVSNEYLSFDDALANPIGGGSGPSTWDKFTVQYVIEDGNNRELGYGIYVRPGSFVRSKVIEQLDNGVYTSLPSGFLSLSGSAIIGVSSGGVNNLMMPTFNLLASNALWLGDDNQQANLTGTTSSGTLAKNTGVGLLYNFSGPKKISGMGVSLSTVGDSGWAGKGDKIHAALFETGVADPNLGGFLLRKVFDEVDPTLDMSASAGPRTINFSEPIWVPPGLYYAFLYVEDFVDVAPSLSVNRMTNSTTSHFNNATGLSISNVTTFLSQVRTEKVFKVGTPLTAAWSPIFIFMV